jgi:hypothetical protein
MNLQHHISSRQPPSKLDFVPESDEAEIRLCAQIAIDSLFQIAGVLYNRRKFLKRLSKTIRFLMSSRKMVLFRHTTVVMFVLL